MIRNDTEYAEARGRLNEERTRLADHEKQLRTTGLKDDEIKRVLDPLRSFHLQLAEEVEGYERLRRGEFADLEDLVGLGQLIISLRIGQGISQKELAQRLGTHESQVSRDERNEYFGVSVERANRILRALKARLHTRVEIETNEPEVAQV
jgi:ribosome-binding protein aMBF1 (putative translation factor)